MTSAQTAPPANAIRHGACDSWWTGAGRTHCGACHETFSGGSAASAHRKGAHGPERQCVDPASVGLVARPMPYGQLWSWPAPEGGVRSVRTGAVA